MIFLCVCRIIDWVKLLLLFGDEIENSLVPPYVLNVCKFKDFLMIHKGQLL